MQSFIQLVLLGRPYVSNEKLYVFAFLYLVFTRES